MKLKYDIKSIVPLSSVEVIVSEYVPDNQIILKQPKDLLRRPSLTPEVTASFHLSIWDLDKGEVRGDCDPTRATEWHMSPARYANLKKMVEDYEDASVKRQELS